MVKKYINTLTKKTGLRLNLLLAVIVLSIFSISHPKVITITEVYRYKFKNGFMKRC